MTVCMYRDIHTLQPYIIDFTQRGCHTLRQVYCNTRLILFFFFPALSFGITNCDRHVTLIGALFSHCVH